MSQHFNALPMCDSCVLQNVLLDTECVTAKLADVGLARLIDNTSTRTNSSHLHGWTLAYAAPVRPFASVAAMGQLWQSLCRPACSSVSCAAL